eukprot:COSAG05_NODE_32_length_28165_cov_450.666714_20_plen_129_part_00
MPPPYLEQRHGAYLSTRGAAEKHAAWRRSRPWRHGGGGAPLAASYLEWRHGAAASSCKAELLHGSNCCCSCMGCWLLAGTGFDSRQSVSARRGSIESISRIRIGVRMTITSTAVQVQVRMIESTEWSE